MTSPIRLRYQTIEFGKTDIHICTLRDKQQFDDPEDRALDLGICDASWPLFGVIWPSSMVLANYILSFQTHDKKILEIGCGMALSSLLLNKQHDDITATDYHPEAELFLDRNTRLNDDDNITFERSDWSNDNGKLGRFDLIIGSDLLYEDQHIKQLAEFIENHANPTCEVILVDPGRGRKNKFTRQMDRYNFINNHIQPEHTDYLDQAFKGYILTFSRAI